MACDLVFLIGPNSETSREPEISRVIGPLDHLWVEPQRRGKAGSCWSYVKSFVTYALELLNNELNFTLTETKRIANLVRENTRLQTLLGQRKPIGDLLPKLGYFDKGVSEVLIDDVSMN